MIDSTSRRHRLGSLFRVLREYLGGGRGRSVVVADPEGLRLFLETRASKVAQASLYGYMRTRAGVRFPELFQDDEFIRLLNIAKWQAWLACLSDLTVYAGGLIADRTRAPSDHVRAIMEASVGAILEPLGVPADAGDEFEKGARRLWARLALTDWRSVPDDGTAFAESPKALVQWAPIVDTLKELDSEIVMNSVRFRWQEVRRDLRQNLDAAALMEAVRHEAASTTAMERTEPGP